MKILNKFLSVFYFSLFIPLLIINYYISTNYFLGVWGLIVVIIASIVFGYTHLKVSSDNTFIFTSSLNAINISTLLTFYIYCFLNTSCHIIDIGYIFIILLWVICPIALMVGLSSLSKIDNKHFKIIKLLILIMIVLHFILLFTRLI